MEDKPAPESGSRERGVQERYSDANVVYHPAIPIKRLGILSYREQRSVADFSRTICAALNREARLARDIGKDIPPDVLDDISAWVGRGCVP